MSCSLTPLTGSYIEDYLKVCCWDSPRIPLRRWEHRATAARATALRATAARGNAARAKGAKESTESTAEAEVQVAQFQPESESAEKLEADSADTSQSTQRPPYVHVGDFYGPWRGLPRPRRRSTSTAA